MDPEVLIEVTRCGRVNSHVRIGGSAHWLSGVVKSSACYSESRSRDRRNHDIRRARSALTLIGARVLVGFIPDH
jgi:hypothetical protein